MTDRERRLIEDFLPIARISVAASSEPRTKGHISTLHIWRARRPLIACRAAVYGALVPAGRFRSSQGPDEEKLGRTAASEFVDRLCQYPGDSRLISQARHHILEAHAERLTSEMGVPVTVESIASGDAPRPRVLDMFAGGGAIPLEAARLGCESHAVELNPVAHLIDLCTTTFPQEFGAGLADDVEQWGREVLARTRRAVTDVLSKVPHHSNGLGQKSLVDRGEHESTDGGLSVVAYYWTRTVPCPNPGCQGTVPLYRQTWLRKKASGYVALKPKVDHGSRQVRYEVVRATSEADLGFDPGEGSEASSTACPFCQAAVEGSYVRTYGDERGFGQQLMCAIALNPEGSGKLYIADEALADGEAELERLAEDRAGAIERELGNSSLDEDIPPTGNAGLATGKSYLYGIKTFRHAFSPRQRFILLTIAREIRRAHSEMGGQGIEADRAKAITTYLGLWLSRLTDKFNTLARWNSVGEKIEGLTSMKRFAMMWDFAELNLFGGATGDADSLLEFITAVIRREGGFSMPTTCVRASATELPYPVDFFDAIITDPPYYDNESYSELSDVCYVWLRPTIGFLYPEHFAGQLTPKKKECVAAAYRQGGKDAAARFYEDCLLRSLQEAQRVTKPGGVLVMVYAHKTTAGWATLVDAIRRAGYEVREAWPLDTEKKGRAAHQDDAALASSIFVVARKRAARERGRYEEVVRPELEAIVRERVGTLWDLGVSGADLVIACVGAGLRAFTRFSEVEYSNGDLVPAERFLAEVETVVLEAILDRLSKEIRGDGGAYSLAGVDPATRFYLLWRYTYRTADLDGGEAIIFANGTHVELDALSAGPNPLITKKIEKKQLWYRLRDYADRGDDDRLGVKPRGEDAPIVDTLHRVLWLMESRPAHLTEFLQEAQPNREQMRLVAQALAGPVLKGGELAEVSPSRELAALGKLTANWRAVVDDASLSEAERQDKRTGQRRLGMS